VGGSRCSCTVCVRQTREACTVEGRAGGKELGKVVRRIIITVTKDFRGGTGGDGMLDLVGWPTEYVEAEVPENSVNFLYEL